MKLYYKPGACSLASHIVLNLLGDKYEVDKVDTALKTTEGGEDYKKINPQNVVPALKVNDGRILTENPALLTYLSGLKPELELLPSDAFEKAEVLEKLAFTSSELHKSFSPFFSGKELSEREKVNQIEIIGSKLEYFENILSDEREYLHGDKIRVSDYFLFVVANWANVIGFGLKRWERVNALVNKISKLPHVVQTMKKEGII